jgi:arsenate reductase
MENTIFYLASCSTCNRILKSLERHLNDFKLQNIKTEPITITQLEALKELAGSYESLFSKRSQQYTQLGLKNILLNEVDYKQYLLQHYTFLKRPVIIFNNQIFIGNQIATIEALKQSIKTNYS